MHMDLSDIKEELILDETKIKLEVMDPEVASKLQAMECSSNNSLKIIEEGADMITVPVNEEKTEEELKFMASFGLLDEQQVVQENDYDFGEEENKCEICSMTFENEYTLATHISLHKSNKHFCRFSCGTWTNHLKDCLDHEFLEHTDRHKPFCCRLCEKRCENMPSLAEHMKTHQFMARFVCAMCRKCFLESLELELHWHSSLNTCGRVKYAVTAKECSEMVSAMTLKRSGSDDAELGSTWPIKIKDEPLDYIEANYEMDEGVMIKKEPLDEEMHKRNINLRLPYSLPPKTKLRLPSIKSNNSPVAQKLPVLSLAKTIPPTTVIKGSNILKTLPNNSMIIRLPPNIQIVKIPNPTTTPNNSLKSGTTLSTSAVPRILKPKTFVSIQSKQANGLKPHQPFVTLQPKQEGGGLPNIKQEFWQEVKHCRNALFRQEEVDRVDSLPESRKIIEELQGQIRSIEETCPLPGTVLQQPYMNRLSNNQLNDLQLTLSSKDCSRLHLLRKANLGIRFLWKCPKCKQEFELERVFRNHLKSMHKISNEEMAELKVEITTMKMKNPATIKKEPQTETAINIMEKPKSPVTVTEPVPATILTASTKPNETSAQKDNESVKANQRNKERRFECDVCHKTFSTISVLNCHKMIHTGELPHKCNFCDKRFRTPGQVRVHQRRHTGEKPFQCKICFLSFGHRETLISHLSRHIGMKRYKCYGCEKYFAVVSGLRSHLRLRPDTCGKVKFTARAHGPRVRVIRGEVVFEPHPEHNGYLRSEDPLKIISDINKDHITPGDVEMSQG